MTDLTSRHESAGESDEYFTPSSTPIKPRSGSINGKPSQLGKVVLVAEDLNNNASHERIDLVNRMAEELRLAQNQLEQSRYESSRLQHALRQELMEHEADAIVLNALKQEVHQDQCHIRSLEAKLKAYEEQSPLYHPDVVSNPKELQALRPETPPGWDNSMDLQMLSDDRYVIDLQSRCELAELRVEQLVADNERLEVQAAERECALLGQIQQLQTELEQHRAVIEDLRCDERDGWAAVGALKRDMEKQVRIAELAQRKVILLSDQLDMAKMELERVQANSVDLETEMARSTPDARENVQRSASLMSMHAHSHSWSEESGRESPFTMMAVMCDVGCQAITSTHSNDRGVQASTVMVVRECQWESSSCDIALQAGMPRESTDSGVQACISAERADVGMQACMVHTAASTQTTPETPKVLLRDNHCQTANIASAPTTAKTAVQYHVGCQTVAEVSMLTKAWEQTRNVVAAGAQPLHRLIQQHTAAWTERSGDRLGDDGILSSKQRSSTHTADLDGLQRLNAQDLVHHDLNHPLAAVCHATHTHDMLNARANTLSQRVCALPCHMQQWPAAAGASVNSVADRIATLPHVTPTVVKAVTQHGRDACKHVGNLDAPVVELRWLPIAGLCLLAGPLALVE
eukprot:TRINITY_DN446_c0_g1_i1.p1 TRINITY_DN446_c0_g1~~TRINITY_DN446_c0_g1_i1.p1  ORF type:complete len:634 (+),score=123.52 TRINITY_DN446_c0_g1_i1:153-2054(+)